MRVSSLLLGQRPSLLVHRPLQSYKHPFECRSHFYRFDGGDGGDASPANDRCSSLDSAQLLTINRALAQP